MSDEFSVPPREPEPTPVDRYSTDMNHVYDARAIIAKLFDAETMGKALSEAAIQNPPATSPSRPCTFVKLVTLCLLGVDLHRSAAPSRTSGFPSPILSRSRRGGAPPSEVGSRTGEEWVRDSPSPGRPGPGKSVARQLS